MCPWIRGVSQSEWKLIMSRRFGVFHCHYCQEKEGRKVRINLVNRNHWWNPLTLRLQRSYLYWIPRESSANDCVPSKACWGGLFCWLFLWNTANDQRSSPGWLGTGWENVDCISIMGCMKSIQSYFQKHWERTDPLSIPEIWLPLKSVRAKQLGLSELQIPCFISLFPGPSSDWCKVPVLLREPHVT